MEMAIAVANFTPGESDALRKAMSAKRSVERMNKLKQRLMDGMAANGVSPEDGEVIYNKLLAFANFGFPESHAASFAYLVYASSWLKCHYPAAFCAALLKAQPMGFYSPQTLVADARRHGVQTRGPDVNASDVLAKLEPGEQGEAVVRLGLKSVRSIGEELAQRIVDNAPYSDIEDLSRRVGMKSTHLENLATAGALASISRDRRSALWAAGPASVLRQDQLELTYPGTEPPALPDMTDVEQAISDIWTTGVSPGVYPTEFSRDRLEEVGALTAAQVREVPDGKRILTAGAVTHRQRPETAAGTVFINLEDETGLTNVICSAGVWAAYRHVASTSSALLIRGIVETADGVTNLLADKIMPFELLAPSTSRDWG